MAPYILIAKPGELRQVRVYTEELRDQVQAAMAAGKSLDEIKQSIKMEKYQNLFMYDRFLPLNIEGMYAHLGGKK